MNNLQVTVLGLGKSGLALARELGARGCRLLLSDTRTQEQLAPVLAELGELEYELEAGGHTARVYEGQDLVVISPGVSIHHPILKAALQAGVPVAGEVEIAARLSELPFVAVTGTNGKSTTVTLIGSMLGRRGLVAGNIGTPLVGQVTHAEPGVEWVVAEISSFQLESTHTFRPRIAVLTNLTPDHLDRHPNLEEYEAAKARMFSCLGHGDVAVLPLDEPHGPRFAEWIQNGQFPAWLDGFEPPAREGRPRLVWFSGQREPDQGVWCHDGRVYHQADGHTRELFDWNFPNLPGPHNLVNGLAATAVALELGVDLDDIVRALREHHNLHFRLERVAVLDGVEYINDSKATNVASVVAALEACPQPIVLIAGGKDKGFDFSELASAIARRVRHLMLIGEAAQRLQEAVQSTGFDSIVRCQSLKEAVERAHACAEPGGSVLLSPACSSFDMFAHAEERGEKFSQFVRELDAEVSV
ncbi:MAG: UDP-N-acetylmuramoyl-L-alanine--D-glutamate ligase [Vulcanimicrobiota bacterium]